MSSCNINAVVGLPNTEEKAYAQTNNRIDKLQTRLNKGLSDAEFRTRTAEARLEASIERRGDALDDRIDGIIAVSADSEGNSELVDIRTGADGTVYDSAGTAVRRQTGALQRDIGGFIYTLTATSDNNTAVSCDIPGGQFNEGAVVYAKHLSMTGGRAESVCLFGLLSDEPPERLIAHLEEKPDGCFVTLGKDYIGLRLYTAVSYGTSGVNAKDIMICSTCENIGGYVARLLDRTEALDDGITELDRVCAKKNDIRNSTNQLTCRIYRRVCCCGDGFTSGYILPDGQAEADEYNEEYSWVHCMEMITGCEYINCGVSQANASSWLSADNGLAKAQAAGRAQAYLVGFGVNDSSGDEDIGLALGTAEDIGTNTESYYGKMSKIVMELYNINHAADIYLFTCPDGEDGDYSSERYDGYNQAVRDIVEYYSDKAANVYCLDLAANAGMFVYNTSLSGDRMNGHYTAAGYEQIAQIICRIWSEYLNTDIYRARAVSLIPYDTPAAPEERTEIAQGDTWTDYLEIWNSDGTRHAYSSSETVRFALSASRSSSDVVLTKELTYDSENNVYIITLTAEETSELTADAVYWFDIGLQYGDTYTRIIRCQELAVVPGISRAVTP